MLFGGLASAQTPGRAPAAPAVTEAITAAFERDYRALTTDSLEILRHRDPQRALAQMAQYVAARLQQLGLTPAGDQGAWLQQYPLPGQRQISVERSMVYLSHDLLGPADRPIASEAGEPIRRETSFNLSADAHYLVQAQAGPWTSSVLRTVLVTGRPTSAWLRAHDFGEAVALYVPSAGTDSMARRQVVEALRAATRWVVVVEDQDSASFAAAVYRARQHPPTYVEEYLSGIARRERQWPWTIAVRAPVLVGFLGGAGVDWTAARNAVTPDARELPGLSIAVSGMPEQEARGLVTAPNVLGMLEGADAELKSQYLILGISLRGHVRAPTNDSLTARPGAADATNAAGLLALATVLQQERARLGRSTFFAVLSGGEQAEGSRAFLHSAAAQSLLEHATYLAVDVVGDNAADTGDASVAVYGPSDMTLATPPAWVTAEYPELGVSVIDSGTAFRPELDSLRFVCRGVPSLYIRRAHQRSAQSPAGPLSLPVSSARAVHLNPELLARILSLVFRMSEAISTTPQPPGWNAEGRKQLAACASP